MKFVTLRIAALAVLLGLDYLLWSYHQALEEQADGWALIQATLAETVPQDSTPDIEPVGEAQ